MGNPTRLSSTTRIKVITFDESAPLRGLTGLAHHKLIEVHTKNGRIGGTDRMPTSGAAAAPGSFAAAPAASIEATESTTAKALSTCGLGRDGVR